MFEQLFNNPILYSLSLTLLHFLWQGLLVGLILKSALLVIDNSKSKLRYGLATLAMLSNLVLAVLTFIIIYSDTGMSISHAISPIPLDSLVNELTLENNSLSYQELVPSILAYALPYLSIFWLATIIVLAGKLLIEVRNVNHLPLYGTVSPTDELLTRFAQLAKQIKLPRTPKLLISLKVDVPMAIGWLKPVVLLPASMVTGLDSAQLEMLLLHELAHIRRHDYLVNFFQTLIELLFFFHPSVNWVGKQMRNEREYCSDDVAVQHCGDAIAYAHTLTDTASLCAKKHCHTIPTMAMAASGGDLKARVIRLVDHHCAPSNDTSKWLAALSLLLALAVVGINQLLTSPLAFHLNSQLPWYDNNSASIKAEIPLVATEAKEQVIKATEMSNSIASQLLSNNKPSIVIANNNNSFEYEPRQLANQKLEQAVNLAMSPVKAAPITARSDFPGSEGKLEATSTYLEGQSQHLTASKENKFATTSVSVQKSEVQSPSQRVLDINTPEVAIKPALLTVKNDNAISIKADSNINTGSKNDTVYPSESQNHKLVNNTPTNTAPTENITKASAPQALDSLPEVHDSESLEVAQSYSQAINEFESQNERYSSSSALNNERTPEFTLSKTQLPTKPEVKSPVLSAAKLLNPTSPVYPSIAKLRGLEMKVKVNFTVDRNGKVKDIDFGKQYNANHFKSAIRSTIRKWRFTPATLNNDAVESKMSKIFSFSLQS